MAHTEGFYIENDVHEILKMSCKKRGDKSKIINDALKKYLNMIYPADIEEKSKSSAQITVESV